MNRLLSWIVSLCLCLSLCGCSAGIISSEDGPTQIYTGSAPHSSQAKSPAPASDNGGPESASEPESAGPVRFAALKGPTGMGLASLMCADSPTYQWTLAASADEITPKLIQGELDVAAVPANLASVLYNRTEGEIQAVAVNTLGVLYLVENGETVHTPQDLRGRTIYSAGKGATPEYALKYMLEQNGLNPETDVSLQWKSEHAECLSALLADESAVAMLPQPFVTTAQMKNPGVRVALDLNEEWEKLPGPQESSVSLVTGVTVVRRSFAEENPQLLKQILEDCKASADLVSAGGEEAAALVEQAGILTKEAALKAIPKCGITFLTGADMKEKLSGYLTILGEQDPAAVGGAAPGDDFYRLG